MDREESEMSNSNHQQKQQTNEQQWKELLHELAACLGCGCTKNQLGLCVQCHKANRRYNQFLRSETNAKDQAT